MNCPLLNSIIPLLTSGFEHSYLALAQNIESWRIGESPSRLLTLDET